MTTRRAALVWTWIVLATAATVLVAIHLGRLEPTLAPGASWPLWTVVVATLGVQSLPIHISTVGGRHTVVLTEVVLAVGLFTQEPTRLVLGVIIGALPALMRLRPTATKFAVNAVQSALWVAFPAWYFHALVEVVEPTPAVVGIAFLACLGSFLGATVSVRIPIGFATGHWRMDDEELRYLGASALTALGAAALTLIGVLLVQQSVSLLALLAIPIAQIVMATAQQARSVDRRAALDFTVDASQRLRQVDDVPALLRELLPGLRRAFGVESAGLLLSMPHVELRLQVAEDGEVMGLPPDDAAGDALPRWLAEQRPVGPTTLRRDESLADVAAELGVRELLVAPLQLEHGLGAITLAGRPLGPFLGDHVELVRTCAAAASSALERHLIARELDRAESRGVELERRASHDALTSLANREVLERELQGALATGRSCAILFVDLDDFKSVNDTYGHATGDAVLVAAAQRLAERVRSGDVAARLGGDEFAVLLCDQGVGDAVAVGRRVLADLDEPVEAAPEITSIRAAIGVAESRPGDSVSDLLARADTAMYVAKRAGGHRVEVAG